MNPGPNQTFRHTLSHEELRSRRPDALLHDGSGDVSLQRILKLQVNGRETLPAAIFDLPSTFDAALCSLQVWDEYGHLTGPQSHRDLRFSWSLGHAIGCRPGIYRALWSYHWQYRATRLPRSQPDPDQSLSMD
jgi:hypothetical protein